MEEENDEIKDLLITSFGYEKSVPDNDLIFDVRHLPYPSKYIIDNLTGLDLEFQHEFLSNSIVQEQINEIKNRILEFISNKNETITIAIGCKNGKHRSVAVVEELNKLLCKSLDWEINISHPYIKSKIRGNENIRERSKNRDRKYGLNF